MSRPDLFKLLALLVITGFALAACGGAKEIVTATVESSKVKVTSTGFECPAPEFPAEVASKELNLFTWTEYIPLDMQECFELVYGVKINHDEYSSMEKMYARLSAGGSLYDLVQPTDYFIRLMVRQNILQELDHGKLPVLKNLDTNDLDLSFDPANQ